MLKFHIYYLSFIFCAVIIAAAASGRQEDPARPKFHFLPEENWLNDPNGMFYFNGYYHVFYQYATTVQWTNLKYWGHAISKDLVTWQRLPIGLYPDQPGADDYGVWSGSAIVVNETSIVAIYTGINQPTVTDDGAQTVCLAYPNGTDGMLINWHKDTANPVVTGPPEFMKGLLVAFRDPSIWNQNGTYYFILGSGVRYLHSVALLYKGSPDLRSWTYQGVFVAGNDDEGWEWECPDYFTLPTPDGKTIDCLFVSIPGTGIGWKVGHTDLTSMTYKSSASAYRYDVGWNYAPKSFWDPVKNRRVQFGWLNEGRSGDMNEKEGWAGVMTLGREIYVREDHTLGLRPLEEQQQLRTGVLFTMANYTFPTNYLNWHNVFKEVKSNQYEFIAKFKISKSSQTSDRFGLIVLADAGFTEYTRLFIDMSANTVGYDLTRGSTNGETDHSINQLNYKVSDTLTLHGFVDHSVIEVFVNEQIVLTPRVYPSNADSLHFGLYYEQTAETQPSKIVLESLVVYGVDSICTHSTTNLHYMSSAWQNGDVQYSETGDLVAHVKGSSAQKRNWTTYWLNHSGRQWPKKCQMKGCSNAAQVGAHVWLYQKQQTFILPTCQSCNKDPDLHHPNYHGVVTNAAMVRIVRHENVERY